MSRKGGQTVVGDLTRDVYETAAALREVGDSLARTAGQSLARWQVLYLLGEQPLTVPTAGRRLGLARQNVQRVVDEMTAEGLVRSFDNPDHQRSPLHALTETGERALERINEAAGAWHRKVLRALSLEDIARGRSFLQALKKVARPRED